MNEVKELLENLTKLLDSDTLEDNFLAESIILHHFSATEIASIINGLNKKSNKWNYSYNLKRGIFRIKKREN